MGIQILTCLKAFVETRDLENCNSSLKQANKQGGGLRSQAMQMIDPRLQP